MVGVILCSKARRLIAASSASTSAIRMFGGAGKLDVESVVSRMSEEVMP